MTLKCSSFFSCFNCGALTRGSQDGQENIQGKGQGVHNGDLADQNARFNAKNQLLVFRLV
jgi:hypothetical protein